MPATNDELYDRAMAIDDKLAGLKRLEAATVIALLLCAQSKDMDELLCLLGGVARVAIGLYPEIVEARNAPTSHH